MERAEQHKLKEYLLNQLTESEEEQVELRLLTEPDFAEEYDIVVNEITDDYTKGNFEGKELEQVERYFFKSPERRNKLKFALALNRYATTANQSESDARHLLPSVRNTRIWVFRVAAVVAAVAIIPGAFWLLRHRTSSPQTFATLTLTASKSERGEGGQPAVVKLPLNADALKISLQLLNSALLETAVRFRVDLENDNGEKKALETSGHDKQSVTVVIPGTELKRGQYFLKVFAVRPDGAEQRIPGNYLFTVE